MNIFLIILIFLIGLINFFIIKYYIGKYLCKKYGHKYIDKKAKIRKRSSEWRVVAKDYKCIIPTCKRCGHTLKPKKLKEIDWCNSLSMPDYMWEEMDKKGYLILN